MTAQMREAREKLATYGGEPGSYTREMMRMFAQSHKSATPAMAVLIIAVGLTTTLWVPRNLVLAWVSLALMSVAAQYGFAMTYLDSLRDEASFGLWRRKFILAEALNGVGWAL
ncbi:MAG TPA: hypothetical protein VEK35_06415, partial [Roseiarcus sp.]|nr:hypothetical protein [Roseiarcus sp.]